MNDEILRDQVNELIRDEIQQNINEYVDSKEETEKGGLGFLENEDELKVNISQREIDKIIKEYKKIKKKRYILVLLVKSARTCFMYNVCLLHLCNPNTLSALSLLVVSKKI